jgi:hypothetical protein
VSADLDDLMGRATADVERSVDPIPAATLDGVRSAVRRRRVLRHVGDTVACLALVGAVGAAAVLGSRDAVPPAHTPAPTATVTAPVTPSAVPTPTPPPAPTGPPVREATIDDATVLARLSAPRTGEVWSVPQPVEAPTRLGADDDGSLYDWYLVGHRGETPIYAATPAAAGRSASELRRSTLDVALYEDQGGTLRRVACPSARTGDACQTVPDPGGVEEDTDTFYDTLTLPAEVGTAGGYTVTTATTRSDGAWALGAGDLAPRVLGTELRVLADLGGGVQLVEKVVPSPAGAPAGTTSVVLAVRLPYGALVTLADQDVPGADTTTFRWDDGVARTLDEPWLSRTAAAGACYCDFATFSVAGPGVDLTSWTRAGATADGRPLYTPPSAQDPVASSIVEWQRASSRTLGDDGEISGPEAYRFASVQDVLDARALFALRGPGGAWLLGLRSDAVGDVVECG